MVDQGTCPTYSHIIIASLAVCFVSVILNVYIGYNESADSEKVSNWLVENKLDAYADAFQENGWDSIEKISQLSELDIRYVIKQSSGFLTSYIGVETRVVLLLQHIKKLNANLRYKFWLTNNFLENHENVFEEHRIHTLEDVVEKMDELKADKRLHFAHFALNLLDESKESLKDYPVEIKSKKNLLYFIWTIFVRVAKLILIGVLMFFGMVGVLLGALFVGCIGGYWPILLRRQFPRLFSLPIRNSSHSSGNPTLPFCRNPNPGWLCKLFGNYFDANKSKVVWNASAEDSIVGNEAVLFVKFYRRNGSVYSAKLINNVKVEVSIAQNMIESTVVYEKEDNIISIHFTPIKSGDYKVSIIANGTLVGQCSYSRYFKPGKIDPFKSSVEVPSSIMVLEENVPELLTFDERDKYGNLCVLEFEELHKYQFVICEMNSGIRITPSIKFLNASGQGDRRNRAVLSIHPSGVFKADIYYDDQILSDNVIFLVLSLSEMAEVNKNCLGSNWNFWYEAYLGVSGITRQSSVSMTSFSMDNKRKKVYCYITPKFLIVKEYWLKIFPNKLFSFRINPTIKISMQNDENNAGMQSFSVKSSGGQSVLLFCKKRNVLVATFLKSLLKNIGGSECFEDKRKYFYSELVKLHSIKANMHTTIKIKRENIVDDTWQVVKGFSPGDWWKKCEIIFEGEQGLDYGGLTREWFHLLIQELFHTSTMFRRFDNDNLQALIHPNPFRTGKYKKMKYYEFAGLILGKCLLECACEQSRQQYVKARFTRSLLSQVLGLPISWKHFETDDKEYYNGKIKYIIDNDPSYLDIYFTEDVYDNENQFIKTMELKPGGSKILVEESNKYEYIQCLAEYRLVESVKDEVAAFLKGFHSLIPDGLLSIFDENEVELLLCGMDLISLADLKANHIKDYSVMFTEVIGWFWTVISSFSQEELARLLQFTTGCSQLPPTGFVGLKPQFRITASGAMDTLPTAHTCFNNLCLPYYSSMENLKSKLLFAITEGSEGFGLS